MLAVVGRTLLVGISVLLVAGFVLVIFAPGLVERLPGGAWLSSAPKDRAGGGSSLPGTGSYSAGSGAADIGGYGSTGDGGGGSSGDGGGGGGGGSSW